MLILHNKNNKNNKESDADMFSFFLQEENQDDLHELYGFSLSKQNNEKTLDELEQELKGLENACKRLCQESCQ